jgi:ubiquinone/menaquinone biosynthesis C-methylase UbiE
MRDVAAAILGPVESPVTVLDSGCGSGANLLWLATLSDPERVQAVDITMAALARCRGLRAPADLPLADAAFDLVVSMDVLQHLTEPDATQALSELRRVLRPGGRVLVRTNAAFGRRRVAQRSDWRLYRASSLRAALSAADLIVDRVTAANALQGLWATVRGAKGPVHRNRHGDGHGLGIPAPVSARRNAAMLRLLRAEAAWLARPGRSLPFGHSLYAVAHRSSVSGTR